MGKLLVKENMNFRGKTTKHVPRLSMEMTATQDHLTVKVQLSEPSSWDILVEDSERPEIKGPTYKGITL